MLIDCDSCAMREIACSDCVVTMLLDGSGQIDGSGQAEFDDDEWRAVDLLADAGLIAPLRLVPLWTSAGPATGPAAGPATGPAAGPATAPATGHTTAAKPTWKRSIA